jgi:hypothetical protein
MSIYNYEGTLTAADLACVNLDHGRVHLFWTLIVLGVIALVGSEVVRRSRPSFSPSHTSSGSGST